MKCGFVLSVQYYQVEDSITTTLYQDDCTLIDLYFLWSLIFRVFFIPFSSVHGAQNNIAT